MATPGYEEKETLQKAAASEALRNNIVNLNKAISGSSFQNIVLASEQKKLISSDFKNNLLDTSSAKSIDMKATELVGQMQRIVSFQPDCLDAFLCVLIEHGSIPGITVAKAIAKDYGHTLPNYETSLSTSTVKESMSSSVTPDIEQQQQEKPKLQQWKDWEISYISKLTNLCVTVTRGDCIGHGSYKVVYQALNTEENVEAAWCELDINTNDKKKISQISNEIKILQNLSHANILQLHHYQIFDKSPTKVMILLTEFMFKDLKCYIKDNLPHISKWGRQVLMGLQYLHEQRPAPVIHRDLKCANLFIDESGDLVKIGEFGLATLEYKEGRTVVGTVAYRAPEVFNRKYNESVDIYSFGMCLLEMFTKETPYEECRDIEEIRDKIKKKELPQGLTKVDDDVLKDIICNCLKFDPSERPTAKELLELHYFKVIY